MYHVVIDDYVIDVLLPDLAGHDHAGWALPTLGLLCAGSLLSYERSSP